MKKRLSLALSFILVFSIVLTACGDKQDFTIPYSEYKLSDYIKLGEYKGLKMEKVDSTVTQEELDAEIKKRLEAAKEDIEIKTGVVKQGDIVNIDYTGKVDDKKFDGGSTKGANLTIGSGQFIPGFEEGLVGVNVGDKKTINVTFPADYHESSLSGKAAEFSVKVNSIKQFKIPELTEDFAKKQGVDNIEEYRTKVESELKKAKEKSGEEAQVGNLWEQIHEKSEVKKYPEKELKGAKADYIKNIEKMAEQYGKTYDEFLKMANMTEKDVKKDAKKYAEATVKSELILFAIAEKEGYKISDKEFNKELDSLVKSQGFKSYDEMKKNSGKDFDEDAFKKQIVMQLTVKKIIDVIKENAVTAQ